LSRKKEEIILDLVTERTKRVFRRFNVNTDFFKKPPSEWDKCELYRKGEEYIKKVKVVNDSAERGIRLLEEYNRVITKDESQKQYVFKVRIPFDCIFDFLSPVSV